MSRGEFRAFLDLLMCADPYPDSNTENEEVMRRFANMHARGYGYEDWIDAYHRFTV